jgi:hypothetical protein
LKKIILYIFFILISVVFADYKITKYEENIKFTDYGREVKLKIKIMPKLQPNYYMNGWSLGFNKSQIINVINAKVIDKKYDVSFDDNNLSFEFDETYNNEELTFIIEYQENIKKITKYGRQEIVSIPDFASGADGILSVEIPENYAVYHMDEQFIQNSNSYTWNGKVKDGGFKSSFFTTLKKAKWKFDSKIRVSSNTNFDKLNIVIPKYLEKKDNAQNYEIITEGKVFNEDGKTEVKFDNYNKQVAEVNVKMTILNNFDDKNLIELNSDDENNINDIDSLNELQKVLYEIKFNNDNITPLHIKIAKWVHENIKYDMLYYAKTMNDKQILSNRRGVCEHYAQLYSHLLKIADIPSIIVEGKAYDTEKNKFEEHAWNLVYVGGKWISTDPTWGLYYGKLPISHILLGKAHSSTINITTSNEDAQINMEYNIKYIE